MRPLKYLITLCILTAAGAAGQDITDLYRLIQQGIAQNTLLVTITGTDGTVCKLVKINGPTISVGYTCKSADGKDVMSPVLMSTTSAVIGQKMLNQGATLCFLGFNPTVASYNFGSFGIAPSKGIAWSCTGDALSANIQNGTAVWP